MSVVETLLIGEKNLQKSKLSVKQPDFLLNLVKHLKNEPEKLEEILKSLNISHKEIEKLIDSLHKKNDAENKGIINILTSMLKNNTVNTPESKKDETAKSLLTKLITKKTSNKEFEEKITHLVLSQTDSLNTHLQTGTPKEKNIVNVLKKMIESKNILKNLTKTEKNEFQNITTLNELIKFADKKNLNLSKIVLSQKNISTAQTPQITVPKLSFSKNFFEIKSDFSKNTLKTKTEANSPVSFLLGVKKDKKSSSDTIQKNETHQNMLFSNIHTDLKQTIINAKESIRHFAQNLKEAVENYKPPVSKISLELNPKELGKIEMTLIHRGDNLQIQINGQNQTVSFFNAHQNELRQTLVNMGYSDVNMSFNQQQNQQNQREKYRQNQQNFSKEEDEFIIEIPYKYA